MTGLISPNTIAGRASRTLGHTVGPESAEQPHAETRPGHWRFYLAAAIGGLGLVAIVLVLVGAHRSADALNVAARAELRGSDLGAGWSVVHKNLSASGRSTFGGPARCDADLDRQEAAVAHVEASSEVEAKSGNGLLDAFVVRFRSDAETAQVLDIYRSESYRACAMRAISIPSALARSRGVTTLRTAVVPLLAMLPSPSVGYQFSSEAETLGITVYTDVVVITNHSLLEDLQFVSSAPPPPVFAADVSAAAEQRLIGAAGGKTTT